MSQKIELVVGGTYRRKGDKGRDSWWDRRVLSIEDDAVYYKQLGHEAPYPYANGSCSVEHFKRIMDCRPLESKVKDTVDRDIYRALSGEDDLSRDKSTMINFELKGDLDKFEETYLDKIREFDLECEEESRNLLSSIWFGLNEYHSKNMIEKPVCDDCDMSQYGACGENRFPVCVGCGDGLCKIPMVKMYHSPNIRRENLTHNLKSLHFLLFN